MAWPKGMVRTPEWRARISAALKGKPKSDAARAAMSAAKTGQPGRPIPDEEREAIRIRMTGRKLSDATLQKLRGRNSVHFGKPPRHKPRVEYRGIKFRSTWEVRVAKRFDELGISWVYEATRFDLGDSTYTPDFFLPEEGAYWEVKGWYDARSQSKVAAFRQLFPEIPLVLATKPILNLMRF